MLSLEATDENLLRYERFILDLIFILKESYEKNMVKPDSKDTYYFANKVYSILFKMLEIKSI